MECNDTWPTARLVTSGPCVDLPAVMFRLFEAATVEAWSLDPTTTQSGCLLGDGCETPHNGNRVPKLQFITSETRLVLYKDSKARNR